MLGSVAGYKTNAGKGISKRAGAPKIENVYLLGGRDLPTTMGHKDFEYTRELNKVIL